VTFLVRALVGALGILVAPPTCAACDAPVRQGAFCPVCVATLVPAAPAADDRLAGFVYGGAMSDAVRRFKFDDRPDLAAPLAAGFGRLVPALRARSLDVVVPVPLHPKRLVERGYNQAALLARFLARALDVPCAPRCLQRTVETSRQTDLTREGRAANVARAFVVSSPACARGRAVLLVDDVETTGATLDACRRALGDAGARVVVSVVLARAEVGAAAVIHGEDRTPRDVAL
jgi:ComF family protein